MSVSVTGLTKKFGEQIAVDSISFDASPGEVLGFLGPNGAGKSTTMKMLTTYLPATSGNATVCGFDIHSQSMQIRKKIGYLPENNPLYLEMYIPEYLKMVCRLHKIRKNMAARINEIMGVTGLDREKFKKIGQLSKGFKQRVGLAQAIIHDPEVLILDEPTSGLDPNQLTEIRELIRNLGKDKTVILSTHIMQEVQAVCDRVIIINNGKLVANDLIENLRNSMEGERVIRIEYKNEANTKELTNLNGVNKVEGSGHLFNIYTDKGMDIRELLFNQAVDTDNAILSMSTELRDLEDVFRSLTSKSGAG